ncbi:hypothetical protein BT63DRAFT_446231 [Microthyrium microscopicum]|uniref:Carbohydrate kinase PfkB domain-containing protein n=1 Tax=Microthyrium microscopicum TaxID=703497 RepID=A0A6A6UJ72_9PEZI|nr:hypothetical protein BT63DRAFT_446231 [Microthyrium microscopicum]
MKHQDGMLYDTSHLFSDLDDIDTYSFALTFYSTVLDRRENQYLKVSEEVRDAVDSQKPIVALESAIYTHGFPYPENLALASELESLVRVNGGVPATIGIIDGVAKVGLTPEELIRLASSAGDPNTVKRYSGGTTIAGTMDLARRTFIQVFATGGLGGVHRGAESSMDISADLKALGCVPVAVISSGCKAFLDLPRTLEYLETQGVPVATFADGREGDVDFPAFWSRDSGLKSPAVVRDELEAARIIHAHFALQLQTGLHFANPIPIEASIPKEEMDLAIAQAIEEADAAGATGNANTPFILAKIKEITQSRSIPANRALIISNVVRATNVAKELKNLYQQDPQLEKKTSFLLQESYLGTSIPPSASDAQPKHIEKTAPLEPDIIVAGSLAMDTSCNHRPHSQKDMQDVAQYTSNPAIITQRPGGVGYNIAKAAHLLQVNTHLSTLVGADLPGQMLLTAVKSMGMATSRIIETSHKRTAQYVATNKLDNNLVVGMADMRIMEQGTTRRNESRWRTAFASSKRQWLAVDANWSAKTYLWWLICAKQSNCKVLAEPVSQAKAGRLINPDADEVVVYPNHLVHITTPNIMELQAMHRKALETGSLDQSSPWFAAVDFAAEGEIVSILERFSSSSLAEQGVPQIAIGLLPLIPCIITTLGPDGLLLAQIINKGDERLDDPEFQKHLVSAAEGVITNDAIGGVYMRLFGPAELVKDKDIVSVNGVGDTFAGALLAAMVTTGDPVEECVEFAQKAAVLSLKSEEAVSPELASLVPELMPRGKAVADTFIDRNYTV